MLVIHPLHTRAPGSSCCALDQKVLSVCSSHLAHFLLSRSSRAPNFFNRFNWIGGQVDHGQPSAGQRGKTMLRVGQSAGVGWSVCVPFHALPPQVGIPKTVSKIGGQGRLQAGILFSGDGARPHNHRCLLNLSSLTGGHGRRESVTFPVGRAGAWGRRQWRIAISRTCLSCQPCSVVALARWQRPPLPLPAR